MGSSALITNLELKINDNTDKAVRFARLRA
ncbi:hypothetical protein DFQ01_12427 [Paenibacillus cellulosilyticus]|uniref:Uncharacterized protein n=1 Tax=Paenibacillus cellulosilyticus TaxID=375489 RepID=A0A2V2YN01_9BACL|nr:hypothetical protein DFQ01_12427 [Paenibacillus cellulosilyticus]